MASYRPVDVGSMRAADFLKVQGELELSKLSRVLKGHGFREVSNCPLCGHRDRELEFVKHGVEYVRCECGVVYAASVAADLGDIYNDGYVVYSKEDFEYRKKRFGFERVSILESVCGDLTNSRVLDMGCGTGFFMSALSDKCCNVYGVEYSEQRRQEALSRDFYVWDTIPNVKFDIITAFDVLEHIPDPNTFMCSLDEHVRPGGFLFFYTPNFDSFSMRAMGKRSPMADGTEHVVLYNRESIKYLADKFNYDIVFYETQGMDIENMLSMFSNIGVPMDWFIRGYPNEFQAVINKAECADSLRVILKKRGVKE